MAKVLPGWPMAGGAAAEPAALLARRRNARRVDDDDPMDDAALSPAVALEGTARSLLPVLVAEPRRLSGDVPSCVALRLRPPRTSSSKALKRSPARTGSFRWSPRSPRSPPVNGAVAADALEDAAARPRPKAGRLPILGPLLVAFAPAAVLLVVLPVPKPPLRLLDEWFPRCWFCCRCLDASNLLR